MNNPASVVISRLGGEAMVSFITGTAYTAPYRWQAARIKGGTGGLIPQRYHRKLIDYARSKGIPLAAEEFLPGEEADGESRVGRRARSTRSGHDAERGEGLRVTGRSVSKCQSSNPCIRRARRG